MTHPATAASGARGPIPPSRVVTLVAVPDPNPYTDWVETVIALATPALPKGFVGQIRLNCFMGNVTNANVEYSVKRR